MNGRWTKLSGQLGILYCLVGGVLIFLGWNGAASYDRVASQVPYVVSGGLGGLALVMVGTGLMVVQAHRDDRAALGAGLAEVRGVLDRIAASRGLEADDGEELAEAEVLAGSTAYHRLDCRLVEGQDGLIPMTLARAHAATLEPCRICAPG